MSVIKETYDGAKSCTRRQESNLVKAITLRINIVNICLQPGLDKLFSGCHGLSLKITLWEPPLGGFAITLA